MRVPGRSVPGPHAAAAAHRPVRARARTRIWTDFVTSRIIPAFHRSLQYQPAREEFLGYLKEFSAEVDAEGPYFLSGELSLIDIAIAPWAVRLWLGVPEEGKGGEDEKA